MVTAKPLAWMRSLHPLPAMLLVLLAAACGSATATAGESLLFGTVSAPECNGGYQILNATVTVRDEHDTIIGTGTTDATDQNSYADQCIVTFMVHLSRRAKFYQLSVGTHGGPTYQHDELKAQGFGVHLSLN
ncbi:MAG TPA: hypothetical protein VKV26_11375 [Dehalococcoidia bacterium]|nr:hypothetical protein [Dehalococcoidia bacterium]